METKLVSNSGLVRNSVCTERKPTRVKVVVRVRPPLNGERSCVSAIGNKIEIINHRNIRENLQYEFSSVFDEKSTQLEIFDTCVRPLLERALSGENVSIFAYGPTGAGKTYTMLGTEEDPGMIPRVIHTLFKTLESSMMDDTAYTAKMQKHVVTLSFLEIYNEKVQDLLNPQKTDLPIRDFQHNIFVAGLTEKVICNFNDFKNLFGPASKNRTVAATKLNDRSSRSHSIVQVKVDTFTESKIFHGKIYLIDLAGSEDNRRTGNMGIRLKESGAINKSLFALGEVVDAINNGLPRIPYRNSKLTRLLQDSIGGTCHSVMITNVAPGETYYYDTYCTLNFASKSRKVTNSNIISFTEVQATEANCGLKRSLSLPSTLPNKRVKASQSDQTLSLSQSDHTSSSSHCDHASSSSQSDHASISSQSDHASSSSQSDHTSSSSQSDHAVTAVPDRAAFSPLLRRQASLEKTVKEFLKEIGSLQQQMKGAQENLQPTYNDKIAGVSLQNVAEIQHHILELKSQLLHFQKQQEDRQRRTESKVHERRKSLRNVQATASAIDFLVLKDKTNINTHQPDGPEMKVFLNHDPNCSLSVDTKPLFKKRFKSTAALATHSTFSDLPAKKSLLKIRSIPSKTEQAAMFKHQQEKQNEEFLEILNTASVKRLQELHTVGAKRARLIFDWRTVHGPFSSFQNLKEIPGFTEKYVNSLLQRNLVFCCI